MLDESQPDDERDDEDDEPSLMYKPFRRRSAPGASPGTVIVDPEATTPTIYVTAYGPDRHYTRTLESVSDLDQHIGKLPVTWIHVDGLGDAIILKQLAERFGIHPLALEDVVNVHQRAKVDEYKEHLFIVARMVTFDERLRSEQVSIFLGQNFVLTFVEDPGDCFDPLRERIKRGHERLREAGPDYLVYCLLDAIIDAYFPVLEEYGNQLDELENQEIETRNAALISVIHTYRRDLLFLRKLIWPFRETIGLLLRDFPRQFKDDTRVYLRDCYDHTVQIIEVAEMYRDMCSDLRDFFFTMVSTRTNEIMKVLTIIATIFIPLTFIAGVYGMNFNDMPGLHWRYGYHVAMTMMGAIGLLLLGFFWRRGWLSDQTSEETFAGARRRWMEEE